MIGAEVETLANNTEPIEVERPVPAVQPFKPFPVDVLPGPARGLVVDGARALQVDPALLAPAVLATMGAAIGNSRVVKLTEDWPEPAVFWCALIVPSGTVKSAALDPEASSKGQAPFGSIGSTEAFSIGLPPCRNSSRFDTPSASVSIAASLASVGSKP